MASNRLTPAMLAMLRNASNGRDLTAGLVGKSEHGGATGTRVALFRRGLIDVEDRITPAGREALGIPAAQEGSQS